MRMRCKPTGASGTFLWSHLLLVSKETGITHPESGRGGRVGDGLPLHRCSWGTNILVHA